MILYDDDNNLLGISKDVIGFLGYDDMEDFQTYTDDVAELFVKKSGYVYKFDNFSWIDYILHSGAANKNAILKLKNSEEIEVKINIKEVFLNKQIENIRYMYEISFVQTFQKTKQTVDTKPQNGGFKAKIEKPTDIYDEYSENGFYANNEPRNANNPEKIKITNQDLHVENIEKLHVKEELPVIEPKVQMQKPLQTHTKAKDDAEGFVASKQIKTIDIKSLQKIIEQKRQEKKSINFEKASKELGLSSEEIGAFAKEFLKYSDQINEAFTSAVSMYDMPKVKKIALELKSISDILRIEELSTPLNGLFNANMDNLTTLFYQYQNIIKEMKKNFKE